jgi:M6 family metalloprotease-like protein
MKRIFTILFFGMISLSLWAAPLRNVPLTLVQPNGDTLHCLASGDEFFNYLHDANGYTIVQNEAGWYVYALPEGDSIKASGYIAGSVQPMQLSLQKHALPKGQVLEQMITHQRKFRQADRPSSLMNVSNAPPAYERNHGVLNNLVVFIKFSDETSYSFSQLPTYEAMCNTGSSSMKTFFDEVSYNKISFNSTYYPLPNGNIMLAYQDSHPRNYYRPRSGNNPIGYNGDSESAAREFALLKNAINYISSEVPTDLNIDINNDNYVDNVTFIISGQPDGWSSLLWAHRWMLYGETAYIHGKRVYDFTFVPQGQLDVSTLCHETFHALGAPDLYHYYNGTNLTPVYTWDLMEVNETPPQQTGAYMKHKYGNWISTIPTITPGKYTLSPLRTSETNNCYKIPIPGNSQQFYVVEYRRRTSSGFESSIPGTGMVIYRIDTRWDGNAEYNGSSRLDEVYAFRPNGTQTSNGNPSNAHFGSNVNRTKFNKTSSPRPFLSGGTYDDYTSITEISQAGETISFIYGEYGKVAYIEIDAQNYVRVGESIALAADVRPADAANKSITWSVADGTGTAHISGATLVGDQVGTVTLTVTAQDGSGISASKTITVVPNDNSVMVTSVSITSAQSVTIGASIPLSATVLPEDATNKSLLWSVTNGSGSAEIDGDYLLGLSLGQVTLTATARDGSGVSDSKTIQVTAVLVSSINITTNESVAVGGSLPLSATVLPENASNKSLSWSVSNGTGSAHISGTTLIADQAGTVTLTATAQDGSGVTASKTIQITAVPVSSINITTEESVPMGSSIPLSATVLPEDASDKSLLWSVTNGTGSAYIADAMLFGDQMGTVTLTATAQDGSGVRASKTITVVDQSVRVTAIHITIPETVGLSQRSIPLSAEVLPTNATNPALSWSVTNLSGKARINNTQLELEEDGYVRVMAAATDGSGVYDEQDVLIRPGTTGGNSNAGVTGHWDSGYRENGQFNIETTAPIKKVSLYSVSGAIVNTSNSGNSTSWQVSFLQLPKGTYIIKVETTNSNKHQSIKVLW